MDHTNPGLFGLADAEPHAPPQRPPCGRNREKWARTARAAVSIPAHAGANAVTIGSCIDSGVEVLPRPHGAARAARAMDQRAWLIRPTDGLHTFLDTGALRIISVERGIVGESADRGRPRA